MNTYMFFDTETTGLVDFKKAADDPSQPRLVQLASRLVCEDPVQDDLLNLIVRPDGFDIPDEATKVHGLTTEYCMENGLPIADVLEKMGRHMTFATHWIGFNPQFDLKMLRGEFRREGLPDHYNERPAIDTMRPCTKICKLPPTEKMIAKNMGHFFKQPNLVEAYFGVFGRNFDGAHGAMADMYAVRDLFYWLLEHGKISLAPKAKKGVAARAPTKPARAKAVPPPDDDLSII